MAFVLSQPAFWAVLFLAAGFLFWLAWKRRLRWWLAWPLRIALLAAVLLAAFAPGGQLARSETVEPQIMVVDQSDSVSTSGRIQIQQQAQAWKDAGENRVVLAVGNDAAPVLDTQQGWPTVDGRSSNLESALNAADQLLKENQGKVILVTDGQSYQADSVSAAVRQLNEQGHTVDTVPLPTRQDPGDGFVGPLLAPSNLWQGTPFEVMIPVFPAAPDQQVQVELLINGKPAGSQGELLEAGYYKFEVPPQPQGIITLEAKAQFSGGVTGNDPFPENNASFSTLRVFAAPQVLFVTGAPDAPQTAAFVAMLQDNNIQADVLLPEQFPTDLATLERYRVIFLQNVLSSQLNQEQMLSMQVFVSKLAGGMVFLGGRNSYTLGGYKNSILEPMLPVKLEPPPRSERPPIVFLLIMDRSSSMTTTRLEGEPQPIALAREAAMRAIETLRPEDYLGVLSFTQDYNWDVPIRLLGDGLALREALDSVNRIEANGSTHMYQAMEEGLTNMLNLPAGAPVSRHILVLSDGQSFDGGLDEFRALTEMAQAQNITVSSIALGEGADQQVMEAIAEAGKGRYYPVSQADDLPRIMIYESQAARAENVQTGQTGVNLGEPEHPILSGMNTSQLPLLNGYNALSSKASDGAEDILVSSNFGDPILAAWQFGLGRVVAWTGDLGEEWTGAWASPASEATFWTQVVRYALVNPALEPAQVNVQVEDTQVVVDVLVQNAAGEPVNLAEVSFSYADVQGETHSYLVPQSSAGTYHLELPRPEEGAYRAIVSYSGEEGQSVEVAAPFSVNPPLEWMPMNPENGTANLQNWAAAGGGQVLTFDELVAADAKPAQPLQEEGRPWWFWALLALILLWPLEIAARRRWLPWTA